MEIKKYDSIVLGGSINGLAVAALLGKSGKKVLLLESSETLGETLQVNEFSPGFNCNMIYDYIRWIDPRIMEKLDLEKHGVKLRTLNMSRIALDAENKHIIFHTNVEKTAESISHHSKKDASRWEAFTKHIQKLTHFLEPMYNTIPPKISTLGIKDIMTLKGMFHPIRKHGTKGLVETIRTIPMMMPELMDEWFESPLLRGTLSASGITHITQGPYSAATMLNFLHHHMYSGGSIHNAKFIENGPDVLIKALINIAKSYDVQIKTGHKIQSIDCSNDICTGVTLESGETYQASQIISSLGPTRTLIQLVGSRNLLPTLRTQIENIKYRGSAARVHFSLRSIPDINGISKEQMQTIFAINPSMEYLEKAYDDCKYGQISKHPYIEFSFPSLIIPSYAPNGKHVLSATIQYVPYHLKDKKWNEDIKNDVIQTVIQCIEKYIPKFSEYIENSAIITPMDIENTLGLTEGNINHGEMTLDQFFFMRPTISTAQYHAPIKNLYLCGPGTHPGGGTHLTDVGNLIDIIK